MFETITDRYLREFVLTSNAIENIYSNETDELYFGQHFKSAKIVSVSKVLLSLCDIHKEIMKGMFDDSAEAGAYRTVSVYIGSKPMVLSQKVSGLMFSLDHRIRSVIANAQSGLFGDTIIELSLQRLHDEGLCIHPFVDGNGRTFRLALNHWRRLCGLPWLIFVPEVWNVHLTRLRKFEKEEYRPMFSWAYETST